MEDLINMYKGKGTVEYHSKRLKTVPTVANFEGSINFLFLFFKIFIFIFFLCVGKMLLLHKHF